MTRTACFGVLGVILSCALSPVCAGESTIRLKQDNDTIYLKDGTKVEGIIILGGAKAVTILTQGEITVEGQEYTAYERTIDRKDIERIERKRDGDMSRTYKARQIDGLYYIREPKKEEPPAGEAQAVAPVAEKPAPVEPKPKPAARPNRPKPATKARPKAGPAKGRARPKAKSQHNTPPTAKDWSKRLPKQLPKEAKGIDIKKVMDNPAAAFELLRKDPNFIKRLFKK